MSSDLTNKIRIILDADACPVKAEAYRVAERYGLRVLVVSHKGLMVPPVPWIERVLVPAGFDAADDWIVENTRSGDIVVTADIPLADRCFKAGAAVITPDGRVLDQHSIGMVLATRNLLTDLRAAGEITSGAKAFSARDRSSFLSSLDAAVHQWKKKGFV